MSNKFKEFVKNITHVEISKLGDANYESYENRISTREYEKLKEAKKNLNKSQRSGASPRKLGASALSSNENIIQDFKETHKSILSSYSSTNNVSPLKSIAMDTICSQRRHSNSIELKNSGLKTSMELNSLDDQNKILLIQNFLLKLEISRMIKVYREKHEESEFLAKKLKDMLEIAEEQLSRVSGYKTGDSNVKKN